MESIEAVYIRLVYIQSFFVLRVLFKVFGMGLFGCSGVSAQG